MSLLAEFNSYHQLNLFLTQPLSSHSHKSWNVYQIDWRDHHSSVSSRGTFWILNLAHCSIVCSFLYISIWFWNRQSQGQTLTANTTASAHQQYTLQQNLHLCVAVRLPVIPTIFWVIAFQAAAAQIYLVINGWLNTGTKTRNILWIKHYLHSYLHKTNTTKQKNLLMLSPLSFIRPMTLLCWHHINCLPSSLF